MKVDDVVRAVGLLERVYAPRQGGRVPLTMAAEDLAWLVAQGLDPSVSVEISHAAAVAAVRAASVTVRDGALAFAASLEGERPHGCFLELALMAETLPTHEAGETWCRVCGLEATVTVRPAERFLRWHTWGTGIPGDMTWMLTALEHIGEAPRAVSPRLAHVLHALDVLPAKAVAGAAFEAVAKLGINKHAARSIVATLAFAGILEAPPRVGLATRFVSFAERDERPSVRNENDSPLCFWKGENGVNWRNAAKLFGIEKDTPLVPLDAIADTSGRAPASPAKAKRSTKSKVALSPAGSGAPTVSTSSPAAKASTPRRSSASGVGQPEAKPSAALKRRPAEVGDVWTFAMTEDAWALAYIWKIVTRQGRRYALTEIVGDRSITKPAAPAAPLRTRPRYDGRWQHWTHSLEKTTGTALLATNVAPPVTTEPEPDRANFGSGNDLVRLAQHCFVKELGY